MFLDRKVAKYNNDAMKYRMRPVVPREVPRLASYLKVSI